MRPVLFPGAEQLRRWNEPDGMPFLIRLVLIAKPVIKGIILPMHRLKPCRAPFPITNHCSHPLIFRKTKQSMQVIRHEQKQLTPPIPQIVIAFGRFDQLRRQVGFRQCAALRGLHPDLGMKQCAVSHPTRCGVMQMQWILDHPHTLKMERADLTAPLHLNAGAKTRWDQRVPPQVISESPTPAPWWRACRTPSRTARGVPPWCPRSCCD